MKYTVGWDDDALESLAAIWTNAQDRRAVNRAQTQIDGRLASDPLRNGRPVSEGLYSITAPPLHAQYEIDDVLRFVRVVSVRTTP